MKRLGALAYAIAWLGLSACPRERIPSGTSLGRPPIVGFSDAALDASSGASIDASTHAAGEFDANGDLDSRQGVAIHFEHADGSVVDSPRGPRWAFRTVGLPAMSADASRVLVSHFEPSLGGAPNLTLVVLRAADGSTEASTPLLRLGELVSAESMDRADAASGALDSLARLVDERVASANAELAKQNWSPLESCSVDDPGSVQPRCSMDAQHIACGALLITYAGGRIEAQSGKQRVTVPATTGSIHAVKDPNGGAVPLRSCFGGVWYMPGGRLLAGELEQDCQRGGDWCFAPSEWHTLMLPMAIPNELRDAALPDGSAGCPQGTAMIPAGTFEMGAVDGFTNERPTHREAVASFCLDITEVSVQDYRGCVRAHGCFTPARDDLCNTDAGTQPVNCVTWSQADRFCRWTGKRLPTSIQWEYAARGSEGRRFPWGNSAAPPDVCWHRGWNGGTCAVGTHAGDRSPFGILDMAGNVAEWTATRAGPGFATVAYEIRGGDWSTDQPDLLRASRRSEMPGSSQGNTLGFRCAK